VGGEDEVQPAGWEEALHGHQQTGVGHVAARVDQGAMLAVDNEELIALDGVVGLLVHQVIKGQTGMRAIVEEFDSHVVEFCNIGGTDTLSDKMTYRKGDSDLH
jgi:hypothetical protein